MNIRQNPVKVKKKNKIKMNLPLDKIIAMSYILFVGNQGRGWQNHPYSRDEIDFLQDSAEEIQDYEKRKEVAKSIGRSSGSVYAKAVELGIITKTKGRATVEKAFYAKRKPDLGALSSMSCTKCGDPLVAEKVSPDSFRVLGIICGHSFYYLAEDLKKIPVRKEVVANGGR